MSQEASVPFAVSARLWTWPESVAAAVADKCHGHVPSLRTCISNLALSVPSKLVASRSLLLAGKSLPARRCLRGNDLIDHFPGCCRAVICRNKSRFCASWRGPCVCTAINSVVLAGIAITTTAIRPFAGSRASSFRKGTVRKPRRHMGIPLKSIWSQSWRSLHCAAHRRDLIPTCVRRPGGPPGGLAARRWRCPHLALRMF